MKRRIRAILLPEPNHWWTTAGALPIIWNATHWRRGPHVSGMARKHPLVTVLILSAYGYHFLGPVKKAVEQLEEAALAPDDGGSAGRVDARSR